MPTKRIQNDSQTTTTYDGQAIATHEEVQTTTTQEEVQATAVAQEDPTPENADLKFHPTKEPTELFLKRMEDIISEAQAYTSNGRG